MQVALTTPLAYPCLPCNASDACKFLEISFFMKTSHSPTRQRIVDSALELFARQGVTETTTRQIADRANINEVTLFRHFGNKHGLLLAVLQECLEKYLLLTQVGETLMLSDLSLDGDLSRFLRYYIRSSLRALESVPELVRSLVGEAGQYPLESRQAISQGISQVNQAIASALRDAIAQAHVELPLPPLKLAKLINTCILGYAILVLTADAQGIWASREEFIATLLEAIVRDIEQVGQILDLPADTVSQILENARAKGADAFAIACVLFGAGVRPEELLGLRRCDCLRESQAWVLRVNAGTLRERRVPLNRTIAGHRYGTAATDPLGAYLEGRGEGAPALFLAPSGDPLTLPELERRWAAWTQALCNPDGSPIAIVQARHTWGIEMLARGIERESFGILGGFHPSEIALYERRLHEKAAIDRAIALDS